MLSIDKTANSCRSPEKMIFERPREKCGIFAVTGYRGPGRAAILAYLGLLALQHRGRESAGIAYCSSGGLELLKGMSLVDQVFTRRLLSCILYYG